MAVYSTSAVVLILLVGLNAYRLPDEEILQRLYDLEMRRQPLFDEDAGYQHLLQQEEEHPLVLDSILPYFPEEEEEDEGIDEDSEPDRDYFHENNIQIRDDSEGYAPNEIRSNDLRDPETAQQSALWGTHYVSGGAGEGKQMLKPNGEEKNKQEVKTDNALPAYCEPPNPCPKGYTESQNCVTAVNDTPIFNRKYILEQQESGYCACDSEHMKQCPNDKPRINTKPDSTDSAIMNALNKQDLGIAAKRLTSRVAKKSPRMFKRSVRGHHGDQKGDANPYMGGPQLRTAAKKSPPAMEWKRWNHFDKMIAQQKRDDELDELE